MTTLRVRAGKGYAWWNLTARIVAAAFLVAFALHLNGWLQVAAWVAFVNIAWRVVLTVKALVMVRSGEIKFEASE